MQDKNNLVNLVNPVLIPPALEMDCLPCKDVQAVKAEQHGQGRGAMSAPGYTHVAFADESNWNQGRFRSISLVLV